MKRRSRFVTAFTACAVGARSAPSTTSYAVARSLLSAIKSERGLGTWDWELGAGDWDTFEISAKLLSIMSAIFVASVNYRVKPIGVIAARGSILTVNGCANVLPPTVSFTVYVPGTAPTPRGSRGVSR